MRKIIGFLVLCMALVGTSAWAQDDGYWPEDEEFGGEVGEEGFEEEGEFEEEEEVGGEEVGVLEREEPMRERDMNAPFQAPVELTLGAGALDGENALGNNTTDFMTGITIDFNASEVIMPDLPVHVALTTGAFWSPGTNLGEDRDGVAVFSVPANVQVGYEFADRLLVGVHGGGNLFYQTEQGTLNIDDTATLSDDNEVSIFPSAGANATFGLTPNIGVTARADWTLADDSTPFIGTLGASFGFQ